MKWILKDPPRRAVNIIQDEVILKATEEASNVGTLLNKSLGTTITATACVAAGLLMPESFKPFVLNTGLFALSGAITNWLAIHMLFEKVPGLYGSGVIPARFEQFKQGINNLIMGQFFTRENIMSFFENTATEDQEANYDFGPIIEKTDLSPAFDGLESVIMESAFGQTLSMLGGKAALEPLSKPFKEKMKASFKTITQTQSFQETIRSTLNGSSVSDEIFEKVGKIVQKRLDELTPEMVKDIIKRMIREHLGWLVVWGGVFGGFIGLTTAFLSL